MLDPYKKQSYQSAEDAVRLINDADRLGKSLKVTKAGDITVKKSNGNGFFLWLRGLFSTAKPGAATRTPKADQMLKSILARKIKIDLESASAHADQQLRRFYDDVDGVAKSGSLRDLCTEWVKIKNAVHLRDRHREDNLLFFNAQQERSKISDPSSDREPSDLTPPAQLTGYPATERSKGRSGKSVEELESDQAMSASLGTIQGDSAGSRPASESALAEAPYGTLFSMSQAVVTDEAGVTVDKQIQDWIDNINQALPTCMVFSGQPGEIVTATLTLPDADHRKLYATLENTDLGLGLRRDIPEASITDDLTDDESYSEPRFDENSRIALQTLKDCGRAEFHLIEADGFSEIFEFGADASEVSQGIASFGRNSPGLTLETGSRLINQEALGTLYVPLLTRFKSRTGDFFRFNKTSEAEPRIPTSPATSRAPSLAMALFKWTKLPDGGAEFEIVQREKIHNLLLNDKAIPVNRDIGWQGDISDGNFGYEIRTKIRVTAEDMRNGNLKNVSVIEPLSMTFRIAPSVMNAGVMEDEN